MQTLIKSTGPALTIAITTAGLATATPAAAIEIAPQEVPSVSVLGFADTPSFGDLTYEHKRYRKHRHRGYGDDNYGYYDDDDYEYRGKRRYRGERVYRDTRVWRGRDGRYYCKRKNGTTGLLIGGAAGALLGREVAGRNGDRTLGAILGAAGGAILGRSIDRKNSRCR
ncbi:glycine zipper 2TM domain-containing protein [Qipengyuania sp. DGS5-3]|uniref:glycine zipper 2TM domain-containing protein n=1 Tax=Qipengyuania sp. DGS5-3 TaxID=3349632 RepID=UPI0036D2B135